MKVETRELSPDLWPQVEKLFGASGACGGCWCMSWRLEKGEDWSKIKGSAAKARLKKLVTTGRARGILAFVDGEPVGWCSFDRRKNYPKLDRAPSLKCEDAAQVWSLPCFYVHKSFRGKGIATVLLARAVRSMKKLGVQTIEGYPVKPYNYGKKIPHAFAWTGTLPMFQKAGFDPVGKRDGGKQRVRKELG